MTTADHGRIQTPDTTGGQEVGVLLGTNIGVVVAGLAIQSLIAYALLPEGRGSYAVCITFGALLAVFFSPGADRGAQFFVMAGRISVSQGVAVATAVCAVGGIVGGLVAIPLIGSGTEFFTKADSRSFYIALALVPLTAYSTALQLQLAGLRRFARTGIFLLLQSTINVVAVIAMVWYLDYGVDGAIVSVAVSHVALICACLWDLARSCGLRPELPTANSLSRVMGYGWKAYISRTGNVVDGRIGILLLGMLATQAEIGLFALGSALMMRFLMIPNSIVPAVLPRIVAHSDGRPELVSFAMRGSLWLTAGALGAFLVVSGPAVRIAFSDAFIDVIPLLWIMAPGVMLHSGSLAAAAYFQGMNRPGICSVAVGLGLGVNFLSLLLLYPAYGIRGAAWAVTIGFACRSAYLGAVFLRTTRVPWMSPYVPQLGDFGRVHQLSNVAISRIAGRR